MHINDSLGYGLFLGLEKEASFEKWGKRFKIPKKSGNPTVMTRSLEDLPERIRPLIDQAKVRGPKVTHASLYDYPDSLKIAHMILLEEAPQSLVEACVKLANVMARLGKARALGRGMADVTKGMPKNIQEKLKAFKARAATGGSKKSTTLSKEAFDAITPEQWSEAYGSPRIQRMAKKLWKSKKLKKGKYDHPDIDTAVHVELLKRHGFHGTYKK